MTVNVHVVGGLPVDSILSQAERLSSNVIVMGTHGRTGLSHVLLGSTAERVVRTAHCPVLTIKYEPGG